MGSWPRTHRKQVIIHTLIVGGFLFFLLFLAEPLFDRFEAISGESKIQQLSLPPETGNIQYGLQILSVTTQTIEIEGWGFIEGHGSKNSSIYIVMKSNENTYVFDTVKLRKDIPIEFKDEPDMDVWFSFIARIPVRKIKNGEYIIGVYITKGDVEALRYIEAATAIVKSKGSVKLTVPMSEMQEIPLPPESGEIRLGVDIWEVTSKKIEIAGWAFIEGQSAEDSKIYVVLKSETATYIFDTVLQKRPDVTAAYVESGLNLDDSGFFARIPVDTLKWGIYELGIYIKKGDIQALQYMDAKLEF